MSNRYVVRIKTALAPGAADSPDLLRFVRLPVGARIVAKSTEQFGRILALVVSADSPPEPLVDGVTVEARPLDPVRKAKTTPAEQAAVAAYDAIMLRLQGAGQPADVEITSDELAALRGIEWPVRPLIPEADGGWRFAGIRVRIVDSIARH